MPPEIIDLKNRFIGYLENFDRGNAIEYAISLLESGKLSVPELYESVLAPALNQIEVPREQEQSLIWREHMMSSIVRTTMEVAYPHVLREKGSAHHGMLVLLACPEEEYHEIGIRMGADFFTIMGYEVAYIGCNTPRDTLLNAVRALKPGLVSLCVTNYLNLAQLPTLVASLKAQDPTPWVYLSGSALRHAGKAATDFGADGVLDSFASIQALGEGKA